MLVYPDVVDPDPGVGVVGAGCGGEVEQQVGVVERLLLVPDEVAELVVEAVPVPVLLHHRCRSYNKSVRIKNVKALIEK